MEGGLEEEAQKALLYIQPSLIHGSEDDPAQSKSQAWTPLRAQSHHQTPHVEEWLQEK